MTRFQHELEKRIDAEIEDLRTVLEYGNGTEPADMTRGRIRSLRFMKESIIPETQEKVDSH